MDPAKVDKAKNRRLTMRKLPRTTVKVECRRGAMGFGKNLTVQFLDLSEGGLRLIVAEALNPKNEVEVQLVGMGQKKPIKRVANVCWSLPIADGSFCIGLAFQKRLLFADIQVLARP